jgi:hypothetical protein
MRLHLLEHDSYDYSRANITLWAERRGHLLTQTYVCNTGRGIRVMLIVSIFPFE